jgi:glyoxylase-like metal-dependent hydrolase (beta-lactamase superfamily II)
MPSTKPMGQALSPVSLPAGITVLERGWLSSNSIVLCGREGTALIDSGYGLHATQTGLLVQSVLKGRSLDVLVNTHLHSDHCGGNAALQSTYPQLVTLIPPGQSQHVSAWNPHALSYTPTGQTCPQFRFDAVLAPGSELKLGDFLWQVHAAPGHDPHSVILFEPASRLLVSADALWERGFGVVFPELDGDEAFEAVGATLDLIESLAPATVIPGHGAAFTDVKTAIAAARERLNGFVADPAKHIRYAAKVLLKFRLLEVQSVGLPSFIAWAQATPYFGTIVKRHFPESDFAVLLAQLIQELVRAGAATQEGLVIRNAG